MSVATPYDRKRIEDLSDRELFDCLEQRLGHDPARSGWTPGLVELHRHSLTRRLVLMPEYWATPLYAPDGLPASVWAGTYAAGVAYDASKQMAFLDSVNRFREELDVFPKKPPQAEANLRQFYWSNTEFSHGDAVLYYSMLRHLRPRRVIEVGGGYSTLLASAAAEQNGGATEIVCIEPFPRPFLEKPLPHVELRKALAQDVPPSFFDSLSDNDVLFIDSSHIAKTGSDVLHLFLRVLPGISPGVWVHVHDIFLPYEYPKHWVEQLLYWNEQYLLAALLANSAKYEVVAGNYFLSRAGIADFQRVGLPDKGALPGGTSFWMRSVA